MPRTELNFPSLTNKSRHATPPKLLVRLFYCPHKAGTFRSEETELIDNNSLDFIIWYIMVYLILKYQIQTVYRIGKAFLRTN